MRKTTTKSNIVGLKELREDMDKYIALVDKGSHLLWYGALVQYLK